MVNVSMLYGQFTYIVGLIQKAHMVTISRMMTIKFIIKKKYERSPKIKLGNQKFLSFQLLMVKQKMKKFVKRTSANKNNVQ